MKKKTIIATVIVVILALIAGICYYANMKPKTTVDENTSDTTPAAKESAVACDFTVYLPSGYSVSDSVDDSTCVKSYIGTPELETPGLTIGISDQNVTNLPAWVTNDQAASGDSEFREKPKAGSLSGSLEVASKDSQYVSIDTFILAGGNVYDIAMYGRDASIPFTPVQLLMYHKLVASFKTK